MAFNNYLEDENDKPYFTKNSLAYYYDKMEGFAKAVEGSAKALNLTKEEIEQRIALRLAEWDKNLESFDGSVEKLLTEWVDDGTLAHVIDSTLIDQKIAPVALKLAEKVGGEKKAEPEDFSDRAMALVTGNGTVNVLSIPQNKSVTPEKTTFIKKSTNLFNKENVVLSTGIDTVTGLPVPNASSSLSGVIYGSPSTPYTRNTGRLAFYDANDTLISSVVTAGTVTVISPVNMSYMRLVSQTAQLDTTQLNEGTQLLPYESYFEPYMDQVVSRKLGVHSVTNETIAPNSIDIKKLDFIKKSSNLFDKKAITEGYSLDSITGNLIANETSSTSDFIEAMPLTTYVRDRSTSRWVEYDANGKVLKVTNGSETITTTSNTSAFRVSFPKGVVDTEQINEGSVLLDYEPYYRYINDELIRVKQATTPIPPTAPIEERAYHFSPEEIVGDYVPVSPKAANGTVIGGFNEAETMSADVYAKYDELMRLYPNYIKKELLGYDSTGVLPIYKYEFKPEEPKDTMNYKKVPKVIIGAGIHGNGQHNAGDRHTTVFALYYLLEDICLNWHTSELLEYLRWNVHFVILPIKNPWGFDNRSRHNANGVDINRNFPEGWSLGTVGANDYGGTEPFSEVETRIIRDVINQNTDALFCTDMHSRGGNPTQETLIWFPIVTNSTLYYPSKYHVSKLSRKWRDKYGLSDIPFYGYVSQSTGGAKERSWVETVVGIPAITIEGFALPSPAGNLTMNDENVLKMNTEMIGNWIVYALKHFKG